MVRWSVILGNIRVFGGDSMKIGTLCKVITGLSHNPSQFGHFIVITGTVNGSDNLVVGKNINTGKTHHYWVSEIKEVKQ